MVVSAAGFLSPVARRWKTQLNENGKTLAHVALFPEHNHNEIVGWESESAVRDLVDLAVPHVLVEAVGHQQELVADRADKDAGVEQFIVCLPERMGKNTPVTAQISFIRPIILISQQVGRGIV